jgi:hypothetical protein
MNNRNLLPEDFLIKRDSSSPLWVEYINYLNTFFEGVEPRVSLSGETDGYYGLIDDCPIIIDSHNGLSVLSLTEWDTIIHSGDDVAKITTYDGLEEPVTRCVQICDDAPSYSGEWARRSDCGYVESIGWVLSEDTITTNDGTIMLEGDHEAVWSDYHSEWLDAGNERTRHGYISSGVQDWFFDRHHDAVEISGEVYRNHSTAEECGWRWHNRRDEWVDADDYCNVDDCNASYHDLERVHKFGTDAKFTIGFEIEKEDDDAGMIHYEDLYDETQWIKEHDGSLDDDTGYELVSPAFNLYDDGLEKDINSDDRLVKLINADKSSSCGGHINVAAKDYDTEQLFEGLSHFFPLLYSLYDGRLDRNYSKAKKKHKYYDKDKYSAIYIKSEVLEFRIFSAVSSVDNLLWRRDLMRIMCDNINQSELDVLRMLLNHKSELYLHLRKVYSQERLIDKIERFIRMCSDFNSKKLPEIVRASIKPDNLDVSNELGA